MSNLMTLPVPELEAMAAAGDEILECYRVLSKGGANIVSEILKGQGTYMEWNHYPEGDVYDGETHSQYYYHAHRGNENEHGHFHTFLRRKGMPDELQPVDNPTDEAWPEGDDVLSHLVAISMDAYGFPIRLFTTNRWVTGENWFAADGVCAMLPLFEIDHAFPSWPVNRWITAMFRLFRPQIVDLIHQRDATVTLHGAGTEPKGVFEDRDLDMTSFIDIDVDRQIERVRRALKSQTA